MTIIPQTGKAAAKGIERILLILLEKGVLNEQEHHSVIEAMLKAKPKEFDGESL